MATLVRTLKVKISGDGADNVAFDLRDTGQLFFNAPVNVSASGDHVQKALLPRSFTVVIVFDKPLKRGDEEDVTLELHFQS